MKRQSLEVRRMLGARREEVFDAWLSAEAMREWMRPGPVSDCEVAMESRVGGRFRIVMTSPFGEIVNEGEILVLDRPARLQFTWVSSRWEREETLVTVELREAGAGCELVLRHERFPGGHSTEQLAAGWNDMLEKLGRLAATPGSE